MIRTFVKTFGLAAVLVVASGHVGSPDTWFQGNAGPYPVTVQVQPAGVIPGVAKIFVRVTGDAPTAVTIQTDKFDATGGAPPPEPTEPVVGDPGMYAGKLWFMTGGSNSVTVNVSGAKGHGRVVVPVVVVAYTRLGLDAPMAWGFAAMGLFLFAGLVTIVGAAVREAPLPPGEPPTDATIRRARIAMALTSVILIGLLAGGWRWWGSEDADYERNMYKPLQSSASVKSSALGRILEVAIADSSWIHRSDSAWRRLRGGTPWTPLIEDHGKLMHLFVISEDMTSFAHLHPSTVDSVDFHGPVPPLPAGRYRVFADIVHESGFTHTMVSSVDVPETRASPQLSVATTNLDDSWLTGTQRRTGSRITLDDGATIEWTGGGDNLAAGKSAALRFEVRNADGSPASLEPYMGMPGHAVVQRADGSVFVHLHPMGTISAASQMAFEMRQSGDTIRGRLGKRVSDAAVSAMSHASVVSGAVSFPYAFPKPGAYRVWVQVKLNGKVVTAAFPLVAIAQSFKFTK